MQKNGYKNSEDLKNDSFSKMAKIVHCAKVISLQNGQFGSNIENGKNVRKRTLQSQYSFSLQEAAPKDNKYFKNDSFTKMTKIGHNWSILELSLKIPKTYRNYTIVLLCKKILKNTLNIRKMLRRFVEFSMQKVARESSPCCKSDKIFKGSFW